MKLMGKSMLAVVGLLSMAMTLGAAWTTRRLTTNAAESSAPGIAVWGEHVYAVWSDETPGITDIYFRKSNNGGTTWQTAMNLSNTPGNSKGPAVAVYGLNVYVVWSDDTPGITDIYFRKSTDGGATWQTRMKLTNNAGSSGGADIAVSGSNVYVVWHDNTPGNYEIFFRKSTDGGATWQTAKRLSNNTGYSFDPRIAINGLNLFLVWDDDTPEDCEIYFRKSTDGGATWQTARKISNYPGESTVPGIAVRNSNVYVVWQDDTPGNWEIYFRKSTDSGATWLTAKKLSINTQESSIVDIAVSGLNVYTAWSDFTPGNLEVFFRKSTDGGATWLTTENLSKNTEYSGQPAIAVGTSKVFVIWADETPGNFEIYVKFSPL